MRHFCIVPECPEAGRHAITLRVRRPDSSAIIAPNSGAYLCDRHAELGFEIDICVKPRATGLAVTYTWAELDDEAGHVEKSVTRIRAGAAGKGESSVPSEPARRVRRPTSKR